jgi:peptidyl-tRNA hydrolase, PTH1 family
MKLIVGLGNPGQKYAKTRHNIGFVFLDKLQAKWEFPAFALNKKLDAEISQSSYKGEKIILAKPQNFINLSGASVQKILAFHKLTPADLFVIHDDKDIVCGKYKLATNSSSAGHNGVQNIIDMLGTKEFKRMRIGIKNENENASAPSKIETSDFVLGKITKEELEEIEKNEKEILESSLL